jgi:hypothetical protein
VVVVAAASVVAGAAVLQPVRLAGATAVLVGSILLGAMIVRARVLPWWCGVLIIIGFPLGDFSNAVVRGGEGIVLGIVWGLVGYALLSARGAVAEPVAERPSRVS